MEICDSLHSSEDFIFKGLLELKIIRNLELGLGDTESVHQRKMKRTMAWYFIDPFHILPENNLWSILQLS